MDRGTARNYVALKVEDPQQTVFTPDTYNNALALAEEQFAVDAKAIIRETTVAMVSGTMESALPTDLICIVLARLNGLKLRPTTKYQLSFQSKIDWTTLPAGQPVEYYVDDEDEKIGLVPAPDDTYSAYTLTLNYVAWPAVINSDATAMLSARNLIQNYVPAVVARAAYEVLSYKIMTPEVIAKRNELLKEYKLYTSECISIYDNMADQPIRMGGGRNWQDNSSPTRGTSNPFSN